MPQKGNEEGLLYEHGECDNGASIVFDYVEWAPLVKNLNSKKTKCSLYFSEKGPGEYYANKVVECSKDNNGANCLLENANYDTLNLAYDKTSDNNLRYIGSNPNNYVKFNDEVWRIVGVMNLDYKSGVRENRIKLVNPNSIGSYIWDNKADREGSSIDHNGSSYWGDSTLKNVLNSGAYWNRTSGECPADIEGVSEPCDFSSNGLTDDAKSYIGNAVWNLGTVDSKIVVIMKDFYDLERKEYAIDSSSFDYNSLWIGKVGLLYPSDYILAVGSDGRNTCINTDKTNWTTEEYSYCKENDWLYFPNYDGYWNITSKNNKEVYRIPSTGGIGNKTVGINKNEVLPSVYLESTVKITGGNGSIDSPYELTNESNESKERIELGKDILTVTSGDGLYAVTHDVSEISSDWNKTEYRFAGTNPNNYVRFNNEIWRVIGLVNAKTSNGIEQRLKIVRTNGIEGQSDFMRLAWDKKLNGNGSSTSDSGSNDWNDSQLKDILNGIYYASGSGDCSSINNGDTCDFTGSESNPRGLSDVSSMIDSDVIWNLGGWETHSLKASKFYEKERGTTVYSSSVHNITRPTEWSSITNVGENFNGIGLIYPSDYVYASNSRSEERETCFEEELYNWNNGYSGSNGCGRYSWLKTSAKSWTMMPRSSSSDDVALILSTGNVRLDLEAASGLNDIWPTLYLKPSIKILPNDNLETYGSMANPFILE